jgi:leucine dehydrogenase
MSVFDHHEFNAHEQVVHLHDRDTGLQAIIAVHNTTRGPALGGCRMWPYPSADEALADVLRLSRAMTYKSALAELPFGGGKSVILGDPARDKTPALMLAMGRAVDSLGGRYVAAEDSGTSVADLGRMSSVTKHVVGIARVSGWDDRERDGDPSPATAYGCFVGIQVAVAERLSLGSLSGVRVAIQGVGNVGRHLAELLDNAGAKLIVSDINAEHTRFAAERFGAKVVAAESIFDAQVDVFAPCAMGAIVNDDTVGRLNASIVAGSANNQLAQDRHGDALAERGILYAPDYAINAGGIIDVASEYAGYDPHLVRERLDGIGDTLRAIFAQSSKTGMSPHRVADQLAEQRLRGHRTGTLVVHPRHAA